MKPQYNTWIESRLTTNNQQMVEEYVEAIHRNRMPRASGPITFSRFSVKSLPRPMFRSKSEKYGIIIGKDKPSG